MINELLKLSEEELEGVLSMVRLGSEASMEYALGGCSRRMYMNEHYQWVKEISYTDDNGRTTTASFVTHWSDCDENHLPDEEKIFPLSRENRLTLLADSIRILVEEIRKSKEI